MAAQPHPWAHDGGDVGVVVIHGFTGSVAETRPLGMHLAARGHTVRCPLLPGHGTRVEDLTRGSYEQWLDAARAALADVSQRCTRTFVVGMSLGSLIALRLAVEDARSGARLAGVVALSPAVRIASKLLPLAVVARHVMRFDFGPPNDDSVDRTAADRNWRYHRTPVWGAAELWRLQRAVLRDLGHVTQPLLAVQGRHDRTLETDAGARLLAAVSSRDKELVWLERSGHNVLLDGEREALYERVAAWLVKASSRTLKGA